MPARTVRAHARRVVPALAATTLLLGACTSATADQVAEPANSDTATTAERAGVRVVDPATAADLLAATPAPMLIDVRTPEEYAQGHIEGATLIELAAPDFAQRIATLDPEASYVIYCRSGNRSATAREVMAELGFTDVADVAGGIQAWTSSGLPTTT